MPQVPEIKIGQFVSIYEVVIDKKVQQLILENEKRSALRWDSYRNMAFKVKSFDDQNLAILVDAKGNEIHISKKALYIVELDS